MKRLISFFQSKKTEWQKKREEKWTQEYCQKETEFKEQLKEVQLRCDSLERQKLDLADIERRVQDRKIELELSNQELKEQIRIIEAKAKPDSVWVNAFNEGFSKAWDMMVPVMKDGVIKMRENIRTEAIDETLDGLEGTINKRIESSGMMQIKPVSELLGKKQLFENKKHQTKDPMEKTKYQNYVDTIEWMLNGNLSEKN